MQKNVKKNLVNGNSKKLKKNYIRGAGELLGGEYYTVSCWIRTWTHITTYGMTIFKKAS